ncbi:MAG: L-threonylcarbamoyladenylate synthase [Flavobacteriales bacterium]|nr:L-threonylcarbamoyladenylate synthase [Flavobacteriales bacterium]
MLIQIHPKTPESRKIKQVVDCLESGGIIIYPTDTVYSIGCDMLNTKAVERVAWLKNVRVEKANFSLVCYDLSHLSEYSKPISNQVFKLMKHTLPGPYTFILEANRYIPKIFSAKKKTIGIRVPDNVIAREIVKQLGRPIMATSVHDEDEILEYTSDAEAIHDKFEKLVDLVIDGGPGGLEPSTILRCIGNEIEVMRVGKGSVDMLNHGR